MKDSAKKHRQYIAEREKERKERIAIKKSMKTNKIIPEIIENEPEIIKKSHIKENSDNTQLVAVQNNTVTKLYATPIRLRTNTIVNCRKSASKVVRLAAAGKISHDEARSLSYMLMTLSGLFRTECDLTEVKELKRRIDQLSEEINGGN